MFDAQIKPAENWEPVIPSAQRHYERLVQAKLWSGKDVCIPLLSGVRLIKGHEPRLETPVIDFGGDITMLIRIVGKGVIALRRDTLEMVTCKRVEIHQNPLGGGVRLTVKASLSKTNLPAARFLMLNEEPTFEPTPGWAWRARFGNRILLEIVDLVRSAAHERQMAMAA